jgi:hypothetical protein
MKHFAQENSPGVEIIALAALRDPTVAFVDAAGDSRQTLELALDLLIHPGRYVYPPGAPELIVKFFKDHTQQQGSRPIGR